MYKRIILSKVATGKSLAQRSFNNNLRASYIRFTSNQSDGSTKNTTEKSEVKKESSQTQQTEKAGSMADAKEIPGKDKKKEPKKPKLRKLKFITSAGLVFGASILGGGIYTANAKQDDQYADLYKKYMPFGQSFLNVMERNNNSTFGTMTDIGSEFYKDLEYSFDFIVSHIKILINMIQTNEWKPKDSSAPEPVKKAASIPKVPSVPSSSITNPVTPSETKEADSFSNPISSIRLDVEIIKLDSAEPLVSELSRHVAGLVNILNESNLSSKYLAELRDISEIIGLLDNRFYELDSIKSDEVNKSISEAKQQCQVLLEKAEENFAQLVEDIKHTNQLEIQIAVEETRNQDMLVLQHKLVELETILASRFNRFVQARVDEERHGRLANLDKVESSYLELNHSAEKLLSYTKLTKKANTFNMASDNLKTSIDKSFLTSASQTPMHGYNSPFIHELNALKSACSQELFPATFIALKSKTLEQAAKEGICTLGMLQDRFEYVAKEIKRVSLVPEDGGVLAHMGSIVLSKVMFTKHGLVEGEDVEAILSRASFYLKDNNLDASARELNQLKGWPKSLAEDWLSAARRRLEVEQLMQVVEAEERTFKLKHL